MVKKAAQRSFHLSPAELDAKAERLRAKLADLAGGENASRRKNILALIRKLGQAREAGPALPSAEERRARASSDRLRRDAKKLLRKQAAADERRRLKNKKRKLNCLLCKKYGHTLANCERRAELGAQANVCYRCGAADHTLDACPQEGPELAFAVCFVCGAAGHLAKDCAQNVHGIFYKGGGCHFCGSKMHKKLECPQRLGAQRQFEFDFGEEQA